MPNYRFLVNVQLEILHMSSETLVRMSLPELRRYPAGTDFIGFGDRVPVVAPEVVFVKAGTARPSRSVLYTSGKEKTGCASCTPAPI